nr:variable large family protein [Borreliella turdi]
MITADKEVEKVGFSNDSIGHVVAQNNAGVAAKDSVNRIAKGIKEIVDAAGRKLDAVKDATTETGKDAGKLFGNGNAVALKFYKIAIYNEIILKINFRWFLHWFYFFLILLNFHVKFILVCF